MNCLAEATSPYLLQHRHNPVDWYEWGPEPLALARENDRPILLSIGYAACHWCHVMERESFEDEATAAVMNALFVNIKVDREERPDIDHLFMSALHALGEQGGWPMTMFLTSRGEPFWGGTYFPKEARYGRPAFVTVLRHVAGAYANEAAKIAGNARALTQAAQPRIGAGSTATDIRAVATSLLRATDPENGGFNGAPKFPNTPVLTLLRLGSLVFDASAMGRAVTLTLDRMSLGGIYDHVGGGFARYSTDAVWLVPHFEKMLYDNALLIEQLAAAFTLTGSPLLRRRVEATIGWLTREMRLADGLFASSLDADSDGVEGRFYTFTPADVVLALGERAAAFCAAHDITDAGNWHDEATGAPVSVPNRLAATGDDASLDDDRHRLRRWRDARVRPAQDDKVLTDWNAFLVVALVRAAAAFDRPDWLALARDTFDRLIAGAARGEAGDELYLSHSRREGVARPIGFASDHAATLLAALALHEAPGTAQQRDGALVVARALARTLTRRFWSDTLGLAMTGAEIDTIVRVAPSADDAVPNAHALAHEGLTRLSNLPGEGSWVTALDRLENHLSRAAAVQPTAHPASLASLLFRRHATVVVLAGPDIGDLAQVARRAPAFITQIVEVPDEAAARGDRIALAQLRAAGSGAAFVCRAQVCSAPIRTAAELRAALAGPGGL